MSRTTSVFQWPRVALGGPALWAPLILALSTGLFAVALGSAGSSAREVIFASLSLGTYLMALLFIIGPRLRDGLGIGTWRIGSWMLLWCGLTSGIATITWSHPQIGTVAQIAITSVLRAMGLVAVGMTAWAIGYIAGPGEPLRRLSARAVGMLADRRGPVVRSSAAPWILYGLGLAGRAATAATTGRFGYVGDASTAVSSASWYGQILSTVALCAPLAVSVAALRVFTERRPNARLGLVTLVVAELIFGAVAGGKQNFVVTVLAVAIPYSVTKRRIPLVALGIVALVFLTVVIPFNQAYRSAARGSAATLSISEAIDTAPATLRDVLEIRGMLAAIPKSFYYLLLRSQEIDSPAVILQRTPGQIGFSSPVNLIEGPAAALVPRAIWPGKPILATGYKFGQEYYRSPSTLYTSSAVTPIGDLYRHGGWVPVLAGMLLLGAIVRLFDDSLNVRMNPQAVLLVLLLFPTFVKGEQDWVTLLAGVPADLIIWWLAATISFGKPRMGVIPRRSLGGSGMIVLAER